MRGDECGQWEIGVLVAFSITPIGKSESVGDSVAEAVRRVRQSGLPNETNAMFTNIEGEWDEVMAAVKEAVLAVATHAPRVNFELKGDIRQGITNSMKSKVDSMEQKM